MQTSFVSKISHEDSTSTRNIKYCFETSIEEKNYKTHHFWKGNNEFRLSGKLVTGPKSDKIVMKACLVAIVLVAFVFYAEILPQLEEDYYYHFLIGFTISLLLFFIFFFLTSFTEPGYLPHQNLLRVPETLKTDSKENKDIIIKISGSSDYHFEKINDINVMSRKESELTGGEGDETSDRQLHYISESSNNTRVAEFLFDSRPDPTYDIDNNIGPSDTSSNSNSNLEEEMQNSDILVINSELNMKELRFCFFCKVFKLERTSHCSKCNCCVRMFDHHCVLVNNCIGKRNYKFFILLVFFAALLNFYLIFSLYFIYYQPTNLFSLPLTIFYFVVCLQSLLIFGLFVFHFVLFCVFGKTTNEFLKDKRAERGQKEFFDGFEISSSLINFEKDLKSNQVSWLNDL